MNIKIIGTKLSLSATYNPDWNAPAKRLGGRWDASSKSWIFDARDEAKVRALAVKIYGTDGSPLAAEDLLTIRCPATILDGRDGSFGGSRPTSWWIAGRQVARAFGRDGGATLGDGVVVVRGGFSSGGSVKNPACTYSDGTVVEVRDVPRAMAEQVWSEYHGVDLLDAAGVVVKAATRAAVTEVTDPIAELELALAAAEGRRAGLLFRIAELRTV